MESNGVDREHHISACLTSPVALEGILLGLHLLAVVEILHGHSALYRAECVARAIGVASYAARLVLQ